MVNDKVPVLAAYALPLVAGPNVPGVSLTFDAPPKSVKLEAVRHDPGRGLLVLDAFKRGIWATVRFDAAGQPLVDRTPTGLDTPPAGFDGLPPEPFEYIVVEGLAVTPRGALFGVRGYEPKGQRDALKPMPAILATDGRIARTTPLVVDGKGYGLSDLICPPGLPDRCFETWSFENEGGANRTDVAGVLAVAPLVDGLPGEPQVCRRFEGKPEGVARYGDTLIVIFDNDLARKRPGDPTGFDLRGDEDFAEVLPLSVCPAPSPR